jgi:hypothetical protein
VEVERKASEEKMGTNLSYISKYKVYPCQCTVNAEYRGEGIN